MGDRRDLYGLFRTVRLIVRLMGGSHPYCRLPQSREPRFAPLEQRAMTVLDPETLRRSYERSAATYDERFRPLQYEKYAAMLGDRADLAPGPWLDLGCGTGLLNEYLAEGGRIALPLVGLDFSRAMLTRARARGVTVAEGTVDMLPFRDAAFGAVLAFTVLHIVPDVEIERRTFAEVARVLVRGGIFVLTVLQARHDVSLRDRLLAAGFRPEPPRACGQDVGYRCARLTRRIA